MKDERGQILIITALIACACLIALAACLHAVSASGESERPVLKHDTLDNVLWAQDVGLFHAAGEAGGSPWEERASLADSFRSRASLPLSSIEGKLIDRGIAYSYAFNASAARDYVEDGDISLINCTGGVLVKRENDNASVCGCAYDVSVTDGASQYRISTVKIWA
jgi:hypothetical protein